MPANDDLYSGMPPEIAAAKERQKQWEEKAATTIQDDLDAINHARAVGEWMTIFNVATNEQQREMLGWDRQVTEKGAAPGRSMTPMVRVLAEMPEEDALWLRRHLYEARLENGRATAQVLEFDGDHKTLEMNIQEILIYG